jgi:hypothetical protein
MRVIQDSDDEFEGDAEIIALPPKAFDASAEQERAKDASSGTGSTGKYSNSKGSTEGLHFSQSP